MISLLSLVLLRIAIATAIATATATAIVVLRRGDSCEHGLSRRPLRVKLPTKWLSWKLKLMSDKTTLPLKWPNIYPAGRAEYTHNEFM